MNTRPSRPTAGVPCASPRWTGPGSSRSGGRWGLAGQSRPFDGGNVDESVFRAVFRLDESETLGRIEPLYGTSRHSYFP